MGQDNTPTVFRRHPLDLLRPRIDSLPHSATHIGTAQPGMVQWEFVITMRHLAIAPTRSNPMRVQCEEFGLDGGSGLFHLS